MDSSLNPPTNSGDLVQTASWLEFFLIKYRWEKKIICWNKSMILLTIFQGIFFFLF